MKKIKGDTWFYESASCIGAYKADNDLLVIDSGNDDSSARKAVRGFEGINVKYVFNTHSHADHCGGNSYYLKKYNSTIISPEKEHCFVNYPVLEPVYLYGASPLLEMKNKFLCAPPSRTDIIVKNEEELSLNLGNNEALFRFIPLKGHSPNMHGIITPDNIAFIGDALLGKDVLNKHGLIFSFDIESHLDSLDSLKKAGAEGYVLSHGGFLEDIDELIVLNRKSIENTSSVILDYLNSDDRNFDDIHCFLYEKFKLKENLSLNILNRSVIKAHIKYLYDLGEVIISAEKGRTVVRRKSL